MLTHALVFPRMAGTLLSLSLSLAALVALPAHAQTSASGPSAEPLWEVGVVAFGLTQQAWPGASESVRRAIALPYVLYRGPVLRIDRGAVGLRAVKQSDFELDIGFAGALGSNAGEAAARQGMPVLGTLLEFGPRARLKLGNDPGGRPVGSGVASQRGLRCDGPLCGARLRVRAQGPVEPTGARGLAGGRERRCADGRPSAGGHLLRRGTRLCDGSATRLRCQGRI